MSYHDKKIIKKIEAEAKKIKPKVLNSKRSAFLNQSGGCGDYCQGVILTGYETGGYPGDGPDSGFFYYDHYANTYTQLIGATGSRHDIARWGDKLYAKGYTGGAGLDLIQEYQIDAANCSVTWLRDIFLRDHTGFDTNNIGGWIDVGNAMDMKDANTIICGSVDTWTSQGAPWTGTALIEVDISGSTGIATSVGFPISGSQYANTPFSDCKYKTVDIIYMQETNQYLAVMSKLSPSCGGSSKILRLFSSSGQILEEVDATSVVPAGNPQPKGLGIYRTQPNGDIFMTGGPGNASVHAVTFGPLTISPAIQNTGLGKVMGATYNPYSCDYGQCYDIGDIGPEGGTIFAVPLGHPQNNGVNQTNYYYEVAQDDIATGGTPSAGFNLTCGELHWNNIGYHANAKAIIGAYGISFDTTDPANAQLVSDVNSGVISTLTIVNTALTPTNQPMFSGTATQPGPYITNITTGPGNVILLEFNTPVIDSYYPLLTQVTFLNNTAPPGWSATGAEWGVHNKPNIVTSTDFGTGHTNTDAIDAYPLLPGNPTGGIHPWLDTHDIAATLCKQQPSAKDDWFLPSYQEFREMMNQPSVVSQLGLNTSTQSSENYYWTSSHRLPPGTTLFNADKYAWAYNTDTDDLELAYRCHALSARPIRRFECEPDPCEVNPTCDCVEYNYRDGSCGRLDGSLCSGSNNPIGTIAPSIWWNTTNAGTTPGITAPSTSDSVIGGEELSLALSRHDVLGGVYSDADFNNSGSGFKISVWDTNYNFIGKWKYDLDFLYGSTYYSGAYDRLGTDQNVNLQLNNVQHLEGDYPVVYYGGKWDDPGSGGSATGVFFKIEWDGNSGNYETGCNSNIFGNPQPYYTPYYQDDWPWYCGPLHNPSDGSFTGVNRPIPRYATYQPLDNIGNPITVYPDIYTANPNYTGGGQIDLTLSSFMLLGACEFCDYDVGDIGPAGGIIVATPNMPEGSVTPTGKFDSNPTNYYYELSPIDIHDFSQGPSPEWGNWISGGIPLDYTGYPTYHNFINGYQNGGVHWPSADPYPIGTGNGEDNTIELMTTNPGANLFFPTGLPTAVELCDSYALNGLSDWFLPSLSEWNFVRNNIPSISNSSNIHDNLYWTSNYLSSDDWQIPNNLSIGHISPATPATQGSHEHALMVDVSTTSTFPLLPGSYFATEAARWKPGKVRAMRRFECPSTPPVLGCTDSTANNYDPLATQDDGSCVYGIPGCTNPNATNYDPNATWDDGSCNYPATGNDPCFSICAVEQNGVWIPSNLSAISNLTSSWIGPIAMENNPIGYTACPWSGSSQYPLAPQDFIAFYDWVVTQIPTLTVGDTFIMGEFDSACFSGGSPFVCWGFTYLAYNSATQQSYFSMAMSDITAICLKYEGIQGYNSIDMSSTPMYFNTCNQPAVPSISSSSCCVSSPIAGGNLARIGNFDLQDSDGTIDSVNHYIK